MHQNQGFQMATIDTVSTPRPGDIIIDIRHPDEVELQRLALSSNTIICLPFFNLAQQLDTLDRQQPYLLYCKKGIMSRLHADTLQKNGFQQVGIYSPKGWPTSAKP